MDSWQQTLTQHTILLISLFLPQNRTTVSVTLASIGPLALAERRWRGPWRVRLEDGKQQQQEVKEEEEEEEEEEGDERNPVGQME